METMPDLIKMNGEEVQQHAVHSESPQAFTLDQAVIEVLGKDQKLLAVKWLEPSAWSTFACLIAENLDGTQKKYFLKCATGDAGKTMLEGEFQGMLEIYKTVPSLVPRPYGCGRFCQAEITQYFLLSDFIEMKEGLPDPVKLSKCIASLQQKSTSPTGKFGFSSTTCHGKIPQQVAWDSSWTSFYKKLLQNALQRDFETNGSSQLFEQVSARLLDQVIPRLLGALESNGRSVKPVLIHGDLWEGNIMTQEATGCILFIDAAAYWAHSEMEIGMWRCERHALRDDKYKNAYLEQMPKSEPAEEWDDRNRLYCVKMNMIHSAHHRGVRERKTAFEDMCFLVDKYAPYPPNEILQDGFMEPFSRAVEKAKSH